MKGTFDINTIASIVTVLLGGAGAFGLQRRIARWFDSVDERFKAQGEELGEVRVAMRAGQKEMRRRLSGIEAQLKPNHGTSHHDRIVKEVRDAAHEQHPLKRWWPDRH